MGSGMKKSIYLLKVLAKRKEEANNLSLEQNSDGDLNDKDDLNPWKKKDFET